jgi:hypothetical protein
VPIVTHPHDPWTHETRTRNGSWRLAVLRTGCACGWAGPTYDLHDTAAGLAYDEAGWAYQDHLDISTDRGDISKTASSPARTARPASSDRGSPREN